MQITSCASTTMGWRNPYSRMLAATLATAAAFHLRAFLGYGFGRSIGQISIPTHNLQKIAYWIFRWVRFALASRTGPVFFIPDFDCDCTESPERGSFRDALVAAEMIVDVTSRESTPD